MTLLRLVTAGLVHHWRMHLAVAMGVMAATAVLTGALLVGDSVRGSLRALAVERLGRIDEVLVVDRFFRADLADELAAREGFAAHFEAAVPAILLRGSVDKPGATRAGGVTIVGTEPRFWQLGGAKDDASTDGESRHVVAIGADRIVLNAPLADELGVDVDDEVVVRIPRASGVPSDTPLGEKSDTVRSRRLNVARVIAARGLGRFGLRPTQQLPRNAYVELSTLQTLLDEPGRVNALFVAGPSADEPPSAAASQSLHEALRPRAVDYGLTVRRVPLGEKENPAAEVFDLSSDRMVLEPALVEQVSAQGAWQPALTYLANTIAARDANGTLRKIPYSTVTGIDSVAGVGPLLDAEGRPLVVADDEIVLNDWAADDLGVGPGDQIELNYYEAESTHGELLEAPVVPLRVKAVVPLQDDEGRPTRVQDPSLTPELAGVTDQETIDDWDLPFELVEEIRPKDDAYWQAYRATPKAFVSLATARRLWSSRFGNTTSLRRRVTDGTATGGTTADGAARQLELEPARLGFVFQPVKRQSLAAASGTTPFDALFLGFSFFIVAAAVMLTALLFRLGVEQRASEVGVLVATGWPRRRVARLLATEGLMVACDGALAGVAIGVGYAWLMLAGLRTWWLAAVSTPFLELHVTWRSLLVGFASGVVVALATIVWSLRRMRKVPARQLLAGQTDGLVHPAARGGRWQTATAWAMLLVAVLVGATATRFEGEAQAGAFFGSGGLFLVGGLLLVWARLHWPRPSGTAAVPSLERLALRNAARNPGRSALTVGLIAAASFLIVALGAFRLVTSDTGTGGFDLVAETSVPLLHDLDTAAGRRELAVPEQDLAELADAARVFALRVRGGDDASCLNLYRPRQPRVLGVPSDFIERGEFAWGKTLDAKRPNPWRLLDPWLPHSTVPCVVDASTATYSLKVGVGDTLSIDDGRGGTVELTVVGLLKNSLFQGDLLVSERNLLRHFPDTAGHRFFLIDVGPVGAERAARWKSEIAVLEAELDDADADDDGAVRLREELAERRRLLDDDAFRVARVRELLESSLGDYGFDAQRADARLAGFLAVQNTYLSTFQSLGGLGLLLGTFGLATVQLRNVLERRGELALLRATGYRRRRLSRLVLTENALLLVGGLALGVAAALVAVLPHWWLGGASAPTGWLAALLAVVLLVGLASGGLAVRAMLKTPVVAALRGN